MAHLLKYDSVLGVLPNKISALEDGISVDGKVLKVLQVRDPKELPWKALGVDLVIESTGIFTDRDKAAMHLDAGAPLVIVSAPSNGADATFVYGVNHNEFDPAKHKVVSNASCTTNCFVPLVKVLDDAFGVENGLMTTVHAYTGDQPTLDRRHNDLYRARAAAMSMIPTSTGAAKALGEVLPQLKGKLDGSAIRVPTPNVSCVDLTFVAKKDVTAADVNEAVRAAAEGEMKGILGYDPAPKVSIDFNHTSYSSIFAPDQTKVTGTRLVRVLAWYDNEWGFSSRMADVAGAMGRLI